MAKDPICGMTVDETRGLKLGKGGNVYYFCSEHCLKKFAKQHGIDEAKLGSCTVQSQMPWYRNKTVIVAALLVALSAFSYSVPLLEPFRKSLFMYARRIWWAIALGLVIGGVIDYFVPREYVSQVLARPRKRTILYAVILGFFMSACSHGILALSIELHKKGASNPAVIAFLLASPWANLPLTVMLIGFFGLKALYIIICALLIAVTTGFMYQFLESRNLIERNTNSTASETGFSILSDMRNRLASSRLSGKGFLTAAKGISSGSVALANMVVWWILIGIGLASLAAAYVPQTLFQNYMGPTAVGLLVTLIVATILEVCSEGTAPLAFEIYRQTAAFGNAFVFLMAGVVTDYTEIGLLWTNVGKRVALFLPLIAVPQVIVLGIVANIVW
jgi:uncharacterized membrane protein YraQ (UPF0718 family)/YHS domain-containing protein